MAYGARLESVLGASPRGFESPILRHRTPGLIGAPGFSLAGTRKTPTRPNGGAVAPRARGAVGAVGVPQGWRAHDARGLWAAAVPAGRAKRQLGPIPAIRRCSPGVERALRGACTLESGPPRDGIIRTSPGQECSKDKGALPGARRILVFPRALRSAARASGALPARACARAPPQWSSFQRLCCRAPRAPAGPLDGLRPRCAQAPRPSTTSAAGSAASSSPGTKSFEARRPDPMQLHPLAQRESMRRRH